MKFHDFHSIHYGQAGKDVNLCSDITYTYKTVEGLPDITRTSSVTIELSNMQGKSEAYPNIEVKLRVLENGIVNMKWNYKLDKDGKVPAGKRTPYEVPDEFITTNNLPVSTLPLSNFLTLNDAPFEIYLKYTGANTPYFTVRGMLLDSYLNAINVQVQTLKGNDFKGIFGLGERANKDFFLKDGVYSMWSRD